MNTRVAGNGHTMLQLSNEELEQLTYCVRTIIDDYDSFDPYSVDADEEELREFLKRIKKTPKPNPDGPGIDFDLFNSDLGKFISCAWELARVRLYLGDPVKHLSKKQLTRLCDELSRIIKTI